MVTAPPSSWSTEIKKLGLCWHQNWPRGSYFLWKTQSPKSFCRSFYTTQQAGYARSQKPQVQVHAPTEYQDGGEKWNKSNSTEWQRPSTDPPSLHPGAPRSERLKPDLCQENVVTGASTPSSALIRRSTPCPNNPLALLHGLPQKVSVLMNQCFRIKTCFLGNSQLALSLQLEQTILINPQLGSLVTRSCQSGLSLI